jgi:kynurenine formamidase
MADNILEQFAKAIAAGKIRVVDLSQPLNADTVIIQLPPEFGKTWPFRLEEISKYDDRGPAWYWNNFSCGEHPGALCAPIHGSAARTTRTTQRNIPPWNVRTGLCD